jgi:ethanolamine ammonia-lyase small subunit
MDQNEMDNLVQKVMRELEQAGLIKGAGSSTAQNSPSQPLPAPVPPKLPVSSPPVVPAPSKITPNIPAGSEKNIQAKDVVIDLPDPTTPEERSRPQVAHPIDPEGLETLMSTTTSRLGVGRAGPRFTTRSWLLFGADQAITQDTLLRDVDEKLLAELGLFSVQTCITGGKQEYLLRPDLGRKLSDDARRVITEKCTKNPKIQVCVGDGLSAQAIESNIRKIFPVIQQGCQAAGLSMGTPFFIKYCRVGVMNDIGDLINPEVLMLLIGERPGLGRADSMSVYLGYHPQAGHTDADRDVICNIYDNGGTNPLEAGAFAVQFAQKMLRQQAAGVKLKMMEK